MKYIDAEKLITEIERRVSAYQKNLDKADNKIARISTDGRIASLKGILPFITSLQHEQPEKTCKTCGFYESNCPFIRGKFISYPNKVCKDYIYSVMKEQEQLEMDLEKDATQFCFDKGLNVTPYQAKTIASHFYELGKNAKEK